MINPIERAKQALYLQAQALDTLASIVQQDQTNYIDILEVLRTAGHSDYKSRIIITGVGKNANIAAKASETMASLGIPSMYLNTAHYSHGDAGFIGHNDVVVHISRSGTTEEMLNCVLHLTKIRPNVRQILLHCNPELWGLIKEKFDFNFCTGIAREIDDNALAPTMSTTLLLALIDSFAINLSAELKFTPQDFLKYHPGGALGKQLRN